MTDVIKAIKDRRSIRSYTDEKLTQGELDVLREAALASPTARNAQKWHFTFVTDKNLLARFNADLIEALSPARKLDPGYDVFYGAPLVVFISGEKGEHWVPIDSGIASENLALAAMGLELGSVILGMPRAVFESEKGDAYRKEFKFPEGYDFQIALSVGHPAGTKDAHPLREGTVDFVP